MAHSGSEKLMGPHKWALVHVSHLEQEIVQRRVKQGLLQVGRQTVLKITGCRMQAHGTQGPRKG